MPSLFDAGNDAECTSGRHDPNAWFAETPKQQAWAKLMCQQCPVLELCHGWAITSYLLEPRVLVVIGGLTERELRTERWRQGVPLPEPPLLPTPAIIVSVKGPTRPTKAAQRSQSRQRAEAAASHIVFGHPERTSGCPTCEETAAAAIS